MPGKNRHNNNGRGKKLPSGVKVAAGVLKDKQPSSAKPAAAARKTRRSSIAAKSRMPLRHADGEKAFWCNDGHIFSDLRELVQGLSEISDATFFYHANNEKNDFSNWIRDVIEDIELAGAISQAANRDEAISYVTARLVYYDF
jgi:hypothetical protein